MGKKTKKKSRTVVKSGVAVPLLPKSVKESENPTTESVDEGVSVSKERNSCPHLVKGVKLDVLSGKIGSSRSIRCEDCREGAADRRGGKGKGKHVKKKGGVSLDSKPDSKSIWVCLECGHYTCGGMGLPTAHHCHAVGHSRKTRHPLMVNTEKPQLCWCFPCDMLIHVDKIEKTDETSHILPDVVKLLKGRSSEKSLVGIEDVSIGGGSVTAEIKSGSLSTSDSHGQGGYVVRGMVNLGNTCFFNSIMQNLLAMNKLRDDFLKNDAPVGPLITSLKKLFTETNPESGFRNIINPRSFFGCVCSKSPQFRGYQQHDSHELLRCLLDGLSTEELAGRKQNGTLKRDGTSSNTLVDALFGGQISSTVCCNECRHSSTVYEPFLDLSLSVPTKKPPSRKAPLVPRTKKTKLPPKRVGKSRVKVNKDADPLPVQDVPSQSSSHESSCPDQSMISVSGEMAVSSADSTVLGSEEVSSAANKEDLSPLNLVTVGESEQTKVLDSVANKMTGSSDDFAWLDYVEDETVIDEYASISEKEDTPEVQDSENKDERLAVFPEQASCETSGPVCFPQEYQNLRPDFSSSNVWEDEAPIQVQNSEVLLLPYKEESSSVGDIMGREGGEDSSSVLGGGPEESEFDVFGGLFNEPEVVAGPAPRPSSSGDVEAVTIIRNISESDPDEVDDTDSPVSVESCLAHFIKPELLSDENAWHCENCSKILQRQKKKAKKQARILSDGNASGSHDESCHASNSCSCSLKVNSSGNGDIKSDKNIESSVSHVQHGTELHNGELQSSSFQQASKEESCNDSAADSCTSGNVQRDAPMSDNDDNDSEECSDKETELESMRVNRDATKRVLIYKAPPVLTIHLKRFSQDARGRLSKLNGHVDFRETLDLRSYMDPRCINEEKYEYQLVGIVEHSGTMRGGHYVAYVRGGQKNREKVNNKENENVNSTWYHASDAYVREVSLDEVLRCEAYILFYERN
ncbi:ubiquitin carboxyl-terminal hydrolase 2-like [Vicia villosa]|uniref:ubiquitin carboxyl-terminal hydrolase 2-like n=1 Tax=Vicia villosa TaxID=3911 RepID=UPI00273C73D3|nr:ubiquitin carboxyl-terminal hydrolase 2-like [Vicia villosa]XP_058755604.1 ubiquitin carboxyl-terminal hydrolase 2-like [Vicia villosa]